MAREVVNQKPTRKTLVTGESLPAITTDSRPIPLGRDEDGEPDAQVRAFAVLARNRSDSPVYISEGPSDDENVIDAGESFQIWEPNGVSNVLVRGDSGGERVEFRTLEAHNDFSITDKIDAFSRALSHFFGTSRRSTTIEGDVDIGTFADTITVDDIQSGTVDIGQFSDTVTIDDITATSATFDVAGTVDIGTLGDTVTVDDIQAGTVEIGDITGQTTTLDIAGNVDVDQIADTIDVNDISTVSDTITIDDITATNADFDGDITGQTNFDLSAAVREGQTEITSVDGANLSEAFENSLGADVLEFHHYDLYEPAAYDGTIERVEFRVFDYSDSQTAGFKLKVDYGSTGSYDTVSPRATTSGKLAEKFGNRTVEVPRFYPNGEVVIVWEPASTVRFSEGDSVAIEIAAYGNENLNNNDDYDAEAEIISTEIKKR